MQLPHLQVNKKVQLLEFTLHYFTKLSENHNTITYVTNCGHWNLLSLIMVVVIKWLIQNETLAIGTELVTETILFLTR